MEGAIRIFAPEVKYSEAGEIVGGLLEVPLRKFVESELPRYEFLTTTAAGKKALPARGVDLDQSKPGASKEILDRARAEIAALASQI